MAWEALESARAAVQRSDQEQGRHAERANEIEVRELRAAVRALCQAVEDLSDRLNKTSAQAQRADMMWRPLG